MSYNITVITGSGSASYTVSTGARGPAGAAGQGVPTGGTTGQVLKKTSGTDYATAWQDETGGGNVAGDTVAAAAKTTPVDADLIPLVDSAASNGLKKLTWANLKATAKTYFDTLYQAVLVSGTNIKTINSSSLLGSGNLSLWEVINTGGSFQAKVGYRYAVTNIVTITDPATAVAGDSYEVFVIGEAGYAFIGGTGYSRSNFPICRYYNGTSWSTPPFSVNSLSGETISGTTGSFSSITASNNISVGGLSTWNGSSFSGSQSFSSISVGGTITIGGNTWNGSAISGAQSFTSTTRPTSAGTGTPAANSLVTYDDSEIMLMRDSCFVPLIFSQGTTSVAASGTSSAQRGYWQLFTSTTASSKAHVYFDLPALIDNAATINFGRRIIVKTKQYMGSGSGLRAGLQYYVQIGRTVSASTTAQLDKKGFGFGVSGTTVTPFVHNGTALTTTLASGSTFSIVTYPWVMLDFRPGDGLYIYGMSVTSSTPVLLATITSGLPSGTSNSADGQLEFLAYDTGSGGANNWLYIGTASISTP